jgi:hypothetical protein
VLASDIFIQVFGTGVSPAVFVSETKKPGCKDFRKERYSSF